MKHICHVFAATAVLLCWAPTIGLACSPDTDSAIGGSYGEPFFYTDNTLPSNFQVVFASAAVDRSPPRWAVNRADERVEIAFEVARTYEYGIGLDGTATVWRPTQPLNPGDEIEQLDCCIVGTLSEPDTMAPPQPVLSLESFRPSETTDDCGPQGADILTLRAGFSIVPEKQLLGSIYVGRTAEEVRAAERVAHIRNVFHSAPGYKLSMYLYPGGLASAAEPFCVAVELEDTAGNRGERSEPLCFDRLDQPEQVSDSDMGTSNDLDMGGASEGEPACATSAHRRPRRGREGLLFLAALLLGLRGRTAAWRAGRSRNQTPDTSASGGDD